MMTNQEIADEIAQIERELEILRSRQALMARWGVRATKVLVAITLLALIAILPVVAVFAFDIFVGTFFIAMSALAVVAVWIISGRAVPAPSGQRRPSQFFPVGASIGPTGGFTGLGFWFGLGQGYKSDAETIEDMIT